MYICVMGIDFASFYEFPNGFYNCSESVVFFVFYFMSYQSTSISLLLVLRLQYIANPCEMFAIKGLNLMLMHTYVYLNNFDILNVLI
jgi:hypothetical protein